MLIPTSFIHLFIQPALTKHPLQLVQGLRWMTWSLLGELPVKWTSPCRVTCVMAEGSTEENEEALANLRPEE